MSRKIVAFVARSFNPADETKIDPIIKLLESFKALGFIWQSAEPSEVESVSESFAAQGKIQARFQLHCHSFSLGQLQRL